MSAGGINANRKYTTDHPWKLAMCIPESLRDAIDAARGGQTRTSWVIDACRAQLEREKRP